MFWLVVNGVAVMVGVIFSTDEGSNVMVVVEVIVSTGRVSIVIVMVGVLFSTDEGSNIMVMVEVTQIYIYI